MTAGGSQARTPVPAVPGWLTLGDVPRLVGSRCTSCGRVSFPARRWPCPGSDCDGSESEPAELSRTGRIWSVTDNRYAPPPPYPRHDGEFEPYAIAAVELEAERMVVLGQLVPGVGADDVAVGDRVELVVDVLDTDDEHDYLVWKWKPVPASAGGAR